jgi:hypothetical protein
VIEAVDELDIGLWAAASAIIRPLESVVCAMTKE